MNTISYTKSGDEEIGWNKEEKKSNNRSYKGTINLAKMS